MTVVLLALWLALVAAWAVHVARRRWKRRTPPRDACEACGRPALFELADITHEGQGGYSAVVACYCRKHAPQGAIKVR